MSNFEALSGQAMQEFQDSLGLTAEEFRAFAEILRSLDVSPKTELMHRLNLRLQDIDPGPSVNWQGERGLRPNGWG